MPHPLPALTLIALLAACSAEPPPFGLTVQVEAATGGTVGLPTSATIAIPPGALAKDASIAIRSEPARSLADPTRDVAGAVWHFRIDGQDHHTFAQPVTIRVPYDLALASGSTLELSHWNGSRWETVAGATNDGAAAVLQASVTSFSAYAATKLVTAAKAQGPGSNGQGFATAQQKAFASPVEQLGYRRRALHVPTKGVLGAGQMFWDVPFAVHLPIEVPYDGGPARIYVSFAAELDAAIVRAHPDRTMQTQTFGIYRMDGKPMPKGSRGAPRHRDGSELVRIDGELPVWTHGAGRDDPSPESLPIAFEHGKHEPFAKKNEGFTYDAFVMDPVEPGHYAVWFAVWPLLDFREAWPKGQQGSEALAITFRCDAIVVRGAEALKDEEIEALAGRKGTAPDAQRVRTSSFELPLQLRRNAWQFHHADVRPLPSKPYASVPLHRVKLEPQFSGRAGKLRIQNERFDRDAESARINEKPPKREGAEISEWHIEFPERILDCGYGDVLIGGKRTCLSEVEGKAGEELFSWPYLHFTNQWPELAGLPESWKGGRHVFSKPIWEPSADGRPLDTPTDLQTEPQWSFGQKRVWPPDAGEPLRYRHLTFDGLSADPGFHSKDPGEFPLMSYRCGPFDVDAYYCRTNFLEGRSGGSNTDPGGVTVADEKDPYRPWYVGFDKRLRKELMKVRAAQATTTAAAMPMARLLRDKAAVEEQLADPDEPIPRARVAICEQFVVSTEAQIQNCKAMLDTARRDATAAYRAILDDLEKGYQLHGERHTKIIKWQRRYEEQAQRIPLELAVMSGDDGALQKALEDSTTQAGSARFRKYEAKLKRERGDYVGALVSIRSSIDLDGTDMEAQTFRRDLEIVFLQTAMTKSQGAIKEHREKFFQYLSERGFKESDRARPRWLRAITGMRDPETAWAAFTTGIGGIVTAFGGRPQSEEENLAVTVQSMTTAYRGLWALRLLMQKYDLTLDVIAGPPRAPEGPPVLKIPSAELLQLLPLQNFRGEPYTAQQAAALGVDINAALALPEVAALVRGDDVALQVGMQQGYWHPGDVRDTWAEWVGDLTSVKNLIMTLLPMSTATGGYMSAAGYWGAGSAEAVAALRASGQMLSGTEHVARMIGWTRAIEALGTGPVGAQCLKMLDGLHRFEKGMGTKTLVGWTIGKLLGSMIFQGVAVYQAEQKGGPVAALLAEAVLMFGMDTDLMLKCLRAARIEPAAVGRVLEKNVVPALEARAKEVNRRKAVTGKVKSVLADRKKGPLTADNQKKLAEIELPPMDEFVPGESAADNLLEPLADAKKQASAGTPDDGAIDAAAAIGEDLPGESIDLASSASRARAVARTLISEPSPGPVRADFDPKLPTRTHERMRGRPLPPEVKVGSAVAEADALLRKGDLRSLKNAKKKLEKLLQRIEAGVDGAENELPEYLVRLKINLAEELIHLPVRVRPKGRPGFTKELLEEEMEAALKLPPDAERLHQGQMGDTYAAGDYVVKKLRPTNSKGQQLGADDILNMAEEEVLNSEMARELGMDVPGAACKILRDANGEVIGADVVFRRVKGKSMHELSAGEIFQCHAELSEHQALRVLRGDFDGKIDNYMLSEDGFVVAIDAGLGDCRARNSGPGGSDNMWYMEGLAGRDHWYTRFFDDPKSGLGMRNVGQDHAQFDFFRKGLVAEESLTYNAAEATAKKIEDLVADEKRLRTLLDRAYGRAYGVDGARKAIRDAVASGDEAAITAARDRFSDILQRTEEAVTDATRVLQKKSKRLDEVLRGLNERNGTELPPPRGKRTGWLPSLLRGDLRPSLRLAA